jgi:hypothetical protein
LPETGRERDVRLLQGLVSGKGWKVQDSLVSGRDLLLTFRICRSGSRGASDRFHRVGPGRWKSLGQHRTEFVGQRIVKIAYPAVDPDNLGCARAMWQAWRRDRSRRCELEGNRRSSLGRSLLEANRAEDKAEKEKMTSIV